jgi:hypothetical protein
MWLLSVALQLARPSLLYSYQVLQWLVGAEIYLSLNALLVLFRS